MLNINIKKEDEKVKISELEVGDFLLSKHWGGRMFVSNIVSR